MSVFILFYFGKGSTLRHPPAPAFPLRTNKAWLHRLQPKWEFRPQPPGHPLTTPSLQQAAPTLFRCPFLWVLPALPRGCHLPWEAPVSSAFRASVRASAPSGPGTGGPGTNLSHASSHSR